MLVKVTQQHIDKGWQYQCQVCPVALAIKSVVKDGCTVYVDPNEITIGTRVVKTPDSCKRFMSKFDHRHHVEPFEFEMDIQPEFLAC